MFEKVATLLRGGRRKSEPVGTVHVVDPSPLNWLHITYNTVEKLVRITTQGKIRPAAMRRYRWADERSFGEVMRWAAPHPPSTHFNLDPRTSCGVTGEYSVRFHLPEPDGLTLGKLRAMHIMSTLFWEKIGFGYERNGTGEINW